MPRPVTFSRVHEPADRLSDERQPETPSMYPVELHVEGLDGRNGVYVLSEADYFQYLGLKLRDPHEAGGYDNVVMGAAEFVVTSGARDPKFEGEPADRLVHPRPQPFATLKRKR